MRHNFIFIKPRKTAGTSVHLAFSVCCGPEDIIAPIGATFEMQRADMGAFAQNFTRNPELERRHRIAAEQRHRKGLKALSQRNRNTGGCTPHMPLERAMEWLPDGFVDRAFKFASERHPYEKALSLAHHKYRPHHPVTFAEYLDQTVKDGAYSGFHLYALDGQSRMDDFILFDSLEADVARIAARIGVPCPPLPRARAGRREDHVPAARVLTPSQKAIVREVCADEFALFGWQP